VSPPSVITNESAGVRMNFSLFLVQHESIGDLMSLRCARAWAVAGCAATEAMAVPKAAFERHRSRSLAGSSVVSDLIHLGSSKERSSNRTSA
jgi:hypothetical protein